MAKQSNGRVLFEGAICIGAALTLSYLKIPIGLDFGGFDGNVSLVLIPLVIFAMRSNVGMGFAAGCIYGVIKFFLTWGVSDISWEMLIFDYTLSYGAVGLAGLFRKSFKLIGLAAFVGCLAKFGVHYLASVTVYSRYVPAAFMGIKNPPLSVYALLYNGTRMLPITVFTVGIFCLLEAMPDILKEQS